MAKPERNESRGSQTRDNNRLKNNFFTSFRIRAEERGGHEHGQADRRLDGAQVQFQPFQEHVEEEALLLRLSMSPTMTHGAYYTPISFIVIRRAMTKA